MEGKKFTMSSKSTVSRAVQKIKKVEFLYLSFLSNTFVNRLYLYVYTSYAFEGQFSFLMKRKSVYLII